MAWTCSSCGATNPTNALTCGKCGGKTPAPKKIEKAWIGGGTFLFFLFYIAGSFLGGTLVAFSHEPTDDQVFAAAQDMGVKAETIHKLTADERQAAKEAAIAKATEEMSVVVRLILQWFIVLLMFPVAGAIIGYISEGRTIIEASFACTIGQVLGFLLMKYAYGLDATFIELGVGVVLGFGLSAAGAYVGEAVQEKRERLALMLSELDEASFS